MRRMVSIMAAAFWAALQANGAHAADKLAFAPPPPWVQPVAIPADVAPDGAAVRLLLKDEQFDLAPGKPTRYFEMAFRIQTPQGLGAGMIALPWNPDFESPVIHKLLIRRGDTVIDVLASGQTFTVVRRETNMENAALDGELTATIQPEGLRVGDIVDFSASIAGGDPVLAHHVEQTAAAWNGMPIARAHLHAQWPASVPVRLRGAGGLAVPKIARQGGIASIDLALDDVKPLIDPKGAPARYRYGRLIEISDFPSWAGIADLMAPLYTRAATLPAQGPLQAELARIKALSTDPVKRAEAALALVQDRVRYVFIGMNDGGLVPADAETTWSRRFGDCKGKTALLLGLLHGLGIEAVPVVVSTTLGDGLDERLPLVGMFDHVLVRATIARRPYWMDGTRTGDTRLDQLTVPAFSWGLPIVSGAKTLVAMMPKPLDRPEVDISLRIDATAGLSLPAPAHAERLLRGDAAVATNNEIANLTGDSRDQALRAFWRGKYDFIDPTTMTSRFDADARELTLVMDGTAKMDWNEGYYETDGVWVGYKADFSRDPGPNRDAPFAVSYPTHSRTRETILLPPDSGTFTLYHGDDVDRTVGGIAYKRHAVILDDVFTVEEEERSLVPEFPAADAPAAEAGLRELYKQTLYIRKPATYLPTAAEIDAMPAETPETAAGQIERAGLFLRRGRRDEALARFTRALAIEPRNIQALLGRGEIAMMEGDARSARRDMDAALAIEPRNPMALRAQGMLALQDGRARDALAAFTTLLEIKPGDAVALSQRASAYRAIGDIDHATADAQAGIKADPRAIDLYLLLANIARSKGDRAGALAQAEALKAANPSSAYAYVVAGRIHDAFGMKDAAMQEFDRALAIEPAPYIYINRSMTRPKSDAAGRMADLDAALALKPKSTDAIAAKADLLLDQHNFAAAVALFSSALAAAPDDQVLLAKRGIAYLRQGDPARANKDFAAARALAKTPIALNSLCWAKGTAGVALESALAECDAALAIEPDNAAIIDSRGLALLRLDRIDEAIRSYDRALALNPASAASLYGRSVAETRKGDPTAAERDRQAAMKLDPDIQTRFEDYGLPPAPAMKADASREAQARSGDD